MHFSNFVVDRAEAGRSMNASLAASFLSAAKLARATGRSQLTLSPNPERTGSESELPPVFCLCSIRWLVASRARDHKPRYECAQTSEIPFTCINNDLRRPRDSAFLTVRYPNKKGRRSALNSQKPQIRGLKPQKFRKNPLTVLT